MADLSLAERSTIEAVVDGMQKRSIRRRRAGRQGWAFLLTGALSIPIIASAFDGMITLPTAAIRIGIALFLTTGIISMVGSLFDSYQGQAAVRTVEHAMLEARREADPPTTAGATAGGGTASSGSAVADGSNDEVDNER